MLFKRRDLEVAPPQPPFFFTEMTRCLYLIPKCHLRTWRSHRGTQTHTSKYHFIWSTSPTSGISLLVEKRGAEQEQGFTLLELSGEVQSCIYHLRRCHPQLINGISCQRRTLKVTAEIKKNKTTSQLEWWHILPAHFDHSDKQTCMKPWWILQWSLNMDVMTAFNVFETCHMSESIRARGHVRTRLHLT